MVSVGSGCASGSQIGSECAVFASHMLQMKVIHSAGPSKALHCFHNTTSGVLFKLVLLWIVQLLHFCSLLCVPQGCVSRCKHKHIVWDNGQIYMRRTIFGDAYADFMKCSSFLEGYTKGRVFFGINKFVDNYI